MSSLALNIDMDRVQLSVQAVIRPAVERALAEADMEGMVIAALKRPDGRHDPYSMMMLGMGRRDATSLLENLVRQGVEEIAKHYVEQHLRVQRGEIEEAFRKMMMGSADRLVRSFAGAVDNALKEDWAFELNVDVSHKKPDSDDD